ncbi:MAG: ribosome biogenesis/translation initiation ATPase RLI [Candidatus Heimdallarchaeota archaeon]|nr:ribosome biogenesis/translation initiation ATPase RLI [Candidatus Heimdallarchaeota archaeon]
MTRLAIVSREDCKSKDCGLVCIKYCPVNLMNYKCIVLDDKKKAVISESLCTGCGICVKKCTPWKALKIINLPEELDRDVTHRYGPNAFKLHRLPLPRTGTILGLVGQNGSGKSTSLKILSGEIMQNLGKFDDDIPNWEEIFKYYRGSELQNYFKKLSTNDLKISIKPQTIDRLPQVVKGVVKDLITRIDERGIADELKMSFNLHHIWDRKVSVLSGGELQRLAIAAAIAKNADAYFIDEPTSYLDIKERLRVAREIRKLGMEKIMVVVEHDLAVLDYMSDQVQLYYGEPGAYGVVTHPMSVRDGINSFLEGYIPSENMRFRSEPLKFNKTELSTTNEDRLYPLISYGEMSKEYDTFKVSIGKGDLFSGDIVGIIGPNGIGKSTFAKLITKTEKATFVEKEIELMRKRIIINDEDDEEEEEEVDQLQLEISYKPQYLEFESGRLVSELLMDANPVVLTSAFFKTELLVPLDLEKLQSHSVDTLSGGELQRVGIAICLAKEADLYIIDEPSAFISAEDRVMVGKTIRRFIMHRRAAGLVIEHDLMLQSYISDRIIHFEGTPGVEGIASSPLSVKEGMNAFLKLQDITFRSDKSSGRPRINKYGSKLDKQQKTSGDYYLGND